MKVSVAERGNGASDGRVVLARTTTAASAGGVIGTGKIFRI